MVRPGGCPVCYQEPDSKQDKVLPRCGSFASGSSFLVLGSHPRSSYRRPLWSTPERLITLYTLNDYQRFEALVSLPLSGDQKPSHLMNRMLALLPDDYKPDFILRGLFLRRLPIDVRSHLLREKVSDPRALALKADELYQSRVSPSAVNLLSEDLQVNLVSSREFRSEPPVQGKVRISPSLSKRSPTPAPTRRSPTPSGLCWFHKKHGDKAQNCRHPFSFSGNE